MSYFEAILGRRPDSSQPPAELNKSAPKPAGNELAPRSLFTARPGERPDSRAPPGSAGRAPSPPTICPLCRGSLVKADGLYHCQGRCRGRWLQTEPGRLVDVAALPFGVCRCCSPPQALVTATVGAACPASGTEYLLLADGPARLSEAAPHGLCQCCLPPQPLLPQEDHLVCQAKPNRQYQRQGETIVPCSSAKGTPSAAETWQAIDEALRRNNASLTVNGLFDLD